MDYLVVIERADDGSYSAYVPDLPGCVSCGDSNEGVREEIAEAIRIHIDSLRRQEERVPIPSATGHLINV